MNPTGTDLLDIFNARPRKGSSPARATSRPTRESRPGGSWGGGSSGGGSSGDGSSGGFGGRGKLVLGGTVMVLLLALAFTAGVGVGRARRGVATPATPSLAAVPREAWGVKSKALPNLGSKADLRTRIVSELYRRWPELEPHTYVADVVDKFGKTTQGQFRMILKDFDSRQDVQAVVRDLSVWQIDGQMPFEGSRPELMSTK